MVADRKWGKGDGAKKQAGDTWRYSQYLQSGWIKQDQNCLPGQPQF
jgi:hypothetical protein